MSIRLLNEHAGSARFALLCRQAAIKIVADRPCAVCHYPYVLFRMKMAVHQHAANGTRAHWAGFDDEVFVLSQDFSKTDRLQIKFII